MATGDIPANFQDEACLGANRSEINFSQSMENTPDIPMEDRRDQRLKTQHIMIRTEFPSQPTGKSV